MWVVAISALILLESQSNLSACCSGPAGVLHFPKGGGQRAVAERLQKCVQVMAALVCWCVCLVSHECEDKIKLQRANEEFQKDPSWCRAITNTHTHMLIHRQLGS